MTIAVDFDGVVHRYSRGWQNGSIYDPPVPGAVNGLRMLMERDAVFIHTSREPEQVMPWLEEQGFDVTIDDRCGVCERTRPDPACEDCAGSGVLRFWRIRGQLLVTGRKLPAVVYLDDRAVRFTDWAQALDDIARYAGRTGRP
ncbi:hypothetical protein [Streptomyces sp. NPDC053560]|uniref:hypothetical protein n=1 Tax=Streptomyces sp. NPDC053560 TaxID=3365711 RepID=UPI0037CEDAB0